MITTAQLEDNAACPIVPHFTELSELSVPRISTLIATLYQSVKVRKSPSVFHNSRVLMYGQNGDDHMTEL